MQGAQDFGQVGFGWGIQLQLAGDDEPADVVRAGLGEGLLRRVGIGGRVEEQDREPRGAACREVERVFAGEQEDAVVGGDFGVGEADEFFEGWDPGAGGGEAAEFGERGVGLRAVKLGVAEAFVACGV